MAELETKETAAETFSEKPAVETSAAMSVAEDGSSNKQLVEEKKSIETTDEKSEVTEASQGTLENTVKNELESPEPSKRVQAGRAWHDRDRDHDHGRGRARGRGGRSRGNNYNRDHSYKHNIKSDMRSREESNDPVEIRKQVEFYFSDSNLPQDAFLFKRVDGPSNNPVSIKLIHSFDRMRRYQPYSAVVAALKDSSTLDVVDGDTCVKRKIPLSEEFKGKPMVEIKKVKENQAMTRTVYAKGFGEEGPSTQFDLEAYFAEFGPTRAVRLRRDDDRTFKGSVYVEFDTVETAKKFLASDPKPSWKGKELLILSKKAYCDGKVDGIRNGDIRPHENVTRYHNKDQGELNNDDWKGRRAEDQANGFDEEPDRHDHKGGRRGFGSSGQRGGRGGRARGRDRYGDTNHHRRDNRHDHNPKTPTIQSTIPSKVSKPESPEQTTPSKPDAAAESTPTKPASSSEDTSSKTNEPEASESKPDQVMTDAGPLDVKGSEPKSEDPAPPLPDKESRKRQREDDESAPTEEIEAKVQKIEENGTS